MRLDHHTQNRLRFLASRIHALGARPTYELLRELAEGADLIPRLEAYAAMRPEIVRATGADRFPPRARIVGGAR